MSEEEPWFEAGNRAPSLTAVLILAALMGVGTILAGVAAMWLIMR